MDDMRKNIEGYSDPTVYSAYQNIESEERAKKLFYVLRYVIAKSGFEIEELKLRDKKTNKLYKQER